MAKSKRKDKSLEQSNPSNDKDSDERFIDFLIENDDLLNSQIESNAKQNDANETDLNETDSSSSDLEDEENRYNGRVLNRKEYFETIYLKYAKDLYSSDKDKTAKSLRKKMKVVLGEDNDKRFVFVNDERIEIEQRVQLNHNKTIALQLTKTRLGKMKIKNEHFTIV